MWNPVQPNAAALAAGDPYLEWATQTQFAYYFATGSGDQFPILLELDGITAEEFATGRWHAPPGWEGWLLIPSLYAHPPAGLEKAKFCTATVTARFFEQLAAPKSALRRVVKRVALSLPTPAETPETFKPQRPPRTAPKPGLVVCAILDDGLAFANERFGIGSKTRIEYLWNQDGPPGGVPGVLYGRELVKHDVGAVLGIDSVLTIARHGGPLVDEEEVYRETGHVEFDRSGHKPVAQRRAHGTHVMDVAYGDSPSPGPGDRPIIAVQLPVNTTRHTSGGLLAAPVLDGLRYILDRADQLAAREKCGPLPVVANLSYGFHAGPHDGSSLLERAIDELIALRRTAAPMSVVLPAGNSFLARCHARMTIAAFKQHRPLQWRIQPDDHTPSFMEIWLPELPDAQIAVRITPPSGPRSPWVREGEVYEWRPAQDVLCKVVYFNGVASGLKRNMVLVAVASTTTHHPTAELAPAGRWSVRIRNLGPEITIDAWIQRDDTPFGYPIWGRQSRFDDVSYEYRSDAGRAIQTDTAASYVERARTISAMATGTEPVVVGGFRRSDWQPAEYSSAGPIVHPPAALPHRAGPDISCASEDSVTRLGLLAAGTRNGSSFALNGSSVAAPQVTRWIVRDMAAGNPGDRAAVTAIPSNAPPTAPAVPVERGGITRVDFTAITPRMRPNEP